MTRMERNKRTYGDIGYKSSGGMTDLFDNVLKLAYRLNDQEYDTFCEKASDEEISLLLTEDPTFAEKREILKILQKYVTISNGGDNPQGGGSEQELRNPDTKGYIPRNQELNSPRGNSGSDSESGR